MLDREHLARIIDEGMADRGTDVRKWPEDEAAAYRVDGWAEGTARARAIQVSKTVDALLVALTSHSTGPEPAEITSDEELDAERRDRQRQQPTDPHTSHGNGSAS